MSQTLERETVIVGGGIAGLYVAWRLKAKAKPFLLLEAEGECGGRIRSRHLRISSTSDTSAELTAELGAMRVPDRHVFVDGLVRKLGLRRADFAPPLTAYYLRGCRLTDDDFRGNARASDFPYKLAADELGHPPHQLVVFAIGKAVQESSARDSTSEADMFNAVRAKLVALLQQVLAGAQVDRSQELSARDWDVFDKHASLTVTPHRDINERPDDTAATGVARRSAKVRLIHIGFWNLLSHFLSDEGLSLVNDGYGFSSVVGNWNAAEAIRWVLEDYAPSQRFYTVTGADPKKVTSSPADSTTTTGPGSDAGMGSIWNALYDQIVRANNQSLKTKCRVTRIHYDGEAFCLTCDGAPATVRCQKVVLALPPRALERISITNLRPDKVSAWWRMLRRSCPHRMVKVALLYREPWWKYTAVPGGDTGRVFTDAPERQIYYFGPEWLTSAGYEPNGHGLVMVYNDSRFTDFWHPFSERESTPQDTERAEWFGSLLRRGSSGTGARDAVRWRVVDKVTQQLARIHRYHVPDPLDGVWMDWSEFGAWHTWWPHLTMKEAVSSMLQPMKMNDFESAGIDAESASLDSPAPLYVCGEAFSDEQGWIEGALKSAEAVAVKLTLKRATQWMPDLDVRICDAGHESYKLYMQNYGLTDAECSLS